MILSKNSQKSEKLTENQVKIAKISKKIQKKKKKPRIFQKKDQIQAPDQSNPHKLTKKQAQIKQT